MLKGSIDAVQDGQCRGWAWDDEASGSVEVELLVDGCVIGSVVADAYREDLEQAGLREGRVAFAVDIPNALCDGCEHRVEIRTGDGRTAAVRESVRILPKPLPIPPPSQGSIDDIRDGHCHGWAVETDSDVPVEVELLIDGEPVGHASANLYRADLEEAGIRYGHVAFAIEIPDGLCDGQYHSAEIRTADGCPISTREAIQILSPPVREPVPPQGAIDGIRGGRCYGWALDADSEAPVEVEVFIDGHSAGQGLADGYRVDLERAGVRGGRAAFAIEIPDALRDSRHHRVEICTLDGRTVNTQEAIQILPKLTPVEFDRRAPWIDADAETFERELAARMQAGQVDSEAESRIRFFRKHGWLKLEQAVPHALIDKVLADVEQAWRDLPPQLVLSTALQSPTPMAEMADVPGFRDTSVRYLDFHNASDAAAEIMMLPAVLRFAELCFGEEVAAMQTLLFENGTQQADHQDFAFVHSLRPACLMGAWVALEDARADAGPLFYWDGSHSAVRKYVFDDGSVLAEGNGPHVRAFERYLGETCRKQGLERLVFTPRKGDLLIWHSALVHGGMPRNDPALTRKSMVSHYSTLAAYPYDRRDPDAAPLEITRNGGVYYGLRREGHIEGRYPIAAREREPA